MTKFSLWKISLLTFICTQSTDLGQIPDIKNLQSVLFFFHYFSFNKHLTMWIFLWSGLFLLTSYMMLQKTLMSKCWYLMSLFLWRQWFPFAPTFGKPAPKSSTAVLFCPLHPLEKRIFSVLLPRYRQMNAYTMDSVTCLGTERTFPIQISWLGTTFLISLGIKKQPGTRVRGW